MPLYSEDGDKTDRKLVSDFQNGDQSQREAAAMRLVAVHTPLLIFLLRQFLLPDQAKVEDILQETFKKIFSKLDDFEYTKNGAFKAWCRRIAINLAINDLKSWPVKNFDLWSPDKFDGVQDRILDPSEKLEFRDLLECVRKIFAFFGDTCNQYLTLFYLHEMGVEDIALIYEKSVRAVKVKIKRCRKQADIKLKFLQNEATA